MRCGAAPMRMDAVRHDSVPHRAPTSTERAADAEVAEEKQVKEASSLCDVVVAVN